MLSPIYKPPSVFEGGPDDPFKPGNYPDHMADAVARSDIEFGPMPATDQLEAMAAGDIDYSQGTERLWWSPLRGALYSTRAGGTLLADIHGRHAERLFEVEREAAIFDLVKGLGGLRRWAGRGALCVSRHSVVTVVMAAASAEGCPDQFELATFLGQHDLDESLGHGDLSTPIGRLAEGLFLEHRKRATAACFHLVRPIDPARVTPELVVWAEQIDAIAGAMEHAWDFGRIPFWVKPGSRAYPFAAYALHHREGRKDHDVFDQTAASVTAQLRLHELLVGRRRLSHFGEGDVFVDVALAAWRELGPLAPPEAA